MTTETIRFSKWQRINLAAAALIILGALFFSIYFIFDLSFLALLSIPLVLVLAAGVFLMGVRAINALLFRIEFLESSFQIHSFSWKGKNGCEYHYSDVVLVKRGLSRGEVMVELAGSKPLRLTPFIYVGREKRLLAEFEKHLPFEKMEPGLEIALSRFKKYDKIKYPIFIGIQAGLYLIVGQMVGMDLARPYHGWQNAIPYKSGTFYKALSVDNQGAVWFATTNVDNDVTQIGRLSGGKTQRWNVPANAFSGKDNAYDMLGVTGNSKGFPVAFLREYVIFWTGKEWKRKPISQKFYWYYGLTVSDDTLLFVDDSNGEYKYWSCPLEEDGCESVSIPSPLPGSGIHPVSSGGTAAGPVLAMGDTKGPITFYQYEGGKWNAITGPLDLWKPFLLAWTISKDGTVWVTKELNADTMRHGYTPGPLAFGHWDGAAGAWLWSATKAFPGSFQQEIRGMTVDPRGRIWITGYFETADVSYGKTAAAFAIHGDRAELVARYTDKNSNLQDDGIVQGPDGRLWSAYSSLASLDAGAEKLPAPIPAWIADLDNNKFHWILIGTVLVLEASYFIILLIIKRKQKESVHPGGNP
jgi:hypothetical protein